MKKNEFGGVRTLLVNFDKSLEKSFAFSVTKSPVGDILHSIGSEVSYHEGAMEVLKLKQLKAKGSSRTQKEAERAKMLEWFLIGDSWSNTITLRREIDLPDVEHAMRRYHEDDEVTEK